MAYPVADSYNCASGGVIAAGRTLWRDKSIVVAGDSLTDWNNSYQGGGYQWGLALARSPVLVSFNAGVAGNQISNLTARWVADVADKNPACVMTRIGTNNLSSGSTTDTTAFSAAYQPIIDWHVENGVKGIIHAVPPEVNTPGSAIAACNAWLAAQCAAHPTLLYFANDSIALGDGGYTANSAYMPDGVHMNGLGRRAQGEGMKLLLQSVFGTAECRLLDPTDNTLTDAASNQHVKNPHMSGTSGTVGSGITGTVPTYWNVSRSGAATAIASIVAADVSDPVQVPWLRVAPQVGASGEAITIASVLQHPAYGTTPESLTRLDLTADVRFNSLDASKFSMLRSFVQDGAYIPSGSHFLHMGYAQTFSESVLVRHGLSRDNVFWADVGHAANTLKVVFELPVSAAGFTTSPGSIDIRCVSVRGKQS